MNKSMTSTTLNAQQFGQSLLRGLGQVMLQESAVSGVLFLIAIAINSITLAIAAALGTLVSTCAAWWLGADKLAIKQGLYGFNGALVGIALLVFFEPSFFTWSWLVLAAAASTLVTASLSQALANAKLSAFTAPFVVVSWICFLAAAYLGRLEPSGAMPAASLPIATAVEGSVNLSVIVNGTLNGVGQVFFQENRLTGLLFLAGLAIHSWRPATFALIGSVVGLLVAWVAGANALAIDAGIYGFNGVLVAIALTCLPSLKINTAIMCLALLLTPLVSASLAAFLQPVGLPGLTMPFVLVTWFAILAQRHFSFSNSLSH